MKVIFHVGYHKTGTTWLQQRLFLPEFGFAQLLDHREVWQLIVCPHALDFDPAPARDMIARRMAERADRDLIPVISSEILCGMLFRGGRESADIAHRIRAIWPEARILLTVRNQPQMITSTYMQYLRRGGTRSLDRFFAWTPSPGYFQFDADHFRYHRLTALYQELLGAGNVLVLPHELLASEPDLFVGKLVRWAGGRHIESPPRTSRIGVSDPEAAAGLLRFINHFRYDDAGEGPLLDCGRAGHMAYRFVSWLFRRWPLSGLFRGFRPVTRMVDRLHAGQFAQSNRRLLEICGPGLELPGYET